MMFEYHPTLGLVAVGAFALKTAIGFGLMYLASAFGRPSRSANTQSPDLTSGTASSRGSAVPLLVGRRLLDPVIAWVGNPEAEPQYTEVESKRKKTDNVVTGYKYYEDAMHVLTVGPATALHGIYERGELIWSAGAVNTNTPSGTSFTADDGSEFVIYWGELEQPQATTLTRYLSVKSRFPRVCYIHWKRKLKGSSRQWPELKYDLTGVGPGCAGTPLGEADKITVDGAIGYNVAYIAWMLLTGSRPYGNNKPLDQIDKTSLEAWATQADAEEIPANVLFGDGSTVGGWLETIARDFGVFYAQVGKRVAFKVLRKPESGDVYNLDTDRVRGNPRPKITHADNSVTRRMYTFPDIAHRFQRNVTEVSSGSAASRGFGYVDSEDRLDTVTDAKSAAKIASIRSTYETTVTSQITFDVMRDGENLHPGDVVDLPTTGRARVSEVALDIETGVATVTANPGLMTNLVVETTAPTTGTDTGVLDVAKDPRVMVVDAPEQGDPDAAIVVLRLRKHAQINGASVHLSAAGGTFVQLLSSLPEVSGGDLFTGESIPTEPSAWAASTAYSVDDLVTPTNPRASKGLQAKVTTAGTTGGTEPTWSSTIGATVASGTATFTMEALDDGPIYRPQSPDYNRVLDLTGDDVAWENEAQYAIFTDGLLVSLRKQTAVAVSDRADSTAYSLDDERIPAGVSTGLVYVVTTAGTSAASEPDASEWEVNEGETVTDGTVTWTARYPRYQLEGIRWTGETRTVGNLTGDTGVYIAESDRFDVITDARIADGVNVCIKSRPTGTGTPIDLSTVTATCVDVTSV